MLMTIHMYNLPLYVPGSKKDPYQIGDGHPAVLSYIMRETLIHSNGFTPEKWWLQKDDPFLLSFADFSGGGLFNLQGVYANCDAKKSTKKPNSCNAARAAASCWTERPNLGGEAQNLIGKKMCWEKYLEDHPNVRMIKVGHQWAVKVGEMSKL